MDHYVVDQAGLAGGLTGAPGAPIVIWVMAHNWSNQRSRGSMWAIFLVFGSTLFLLLCLSFGWRVLATVPPAVLLIPIAVIGSHVGLKLGNLISKKYLRRIAFVLLLLVAASAILP